MNRGLGIDTGGTYTDAVLFDLDAGVLLASAKSVTVKEDLSLGIEGAIEGLPPDLLGEVGLVSLSTTLATNACVEGKGGRATLVLIGCDREIVADYGKEYGLPPEREIVFLDGGHDQQGTLKAEPDWEALRKAVLERSGATDAFAVVELWGIRNPESEKKAKELLAGWTGLPTVSGHELTAEVNSLKRAASALLNAHLMPIINDFLDAVGKSLSRLDIAAPLVIVRGDGSLMSEEFARGRPVETLLSGPAASVAGGLHLSGKKDCVVIDMGGTTSDIAVVRKGLPRLALEGAHVGSWRTGIPSVSIDTIGLGGDSIVRHTAENDLGIGPARAAPLSWMASRWPATLGRLKELRDQGRRDELPLCEFLYLVRDVSDDTWYDDTERGIVRALRGGPLDISRLADATGGSVIALRTKRLEQHGAIMRCALTPTDIMHIRGDFDAWNAEAAAIGAAIMARQIGSGIDEVVERVYENARERLYCAIVRALMEDEDGSLLKGGISRQLERLLKKSYREGRAREGQAPAMRSGFAGQSGAGRASDAAGESDAGAFLGSAFTTSASLVGIGAPIHVFLPEVARALGAEFVVPPDAGVANAVGAITGNVLAEASVLIRPRYTISGVTGYLAYSSEENRSFVELEEALEWAKARAAELALGEAVRRGAADAAVELRVEANEADITTGIVEGGGGGAGDTGAHASPSRPSRILVETIVKARASGKIRPA
ncbi:MAG TPA: hydantoinase/oxoprolinase family protein [Rectinemataceae bacterium]|nr:hydantoinase/oxoprolinase family protein [Rectinemataceae bacterium]